MGEYKRLTGLMDEPPINFYPSLAKRTGVNKALILQEIHFLCTSKKQAEDARTLRDGRYWVYNTIDQWVERYFPWMSVHSAKRDFRELERVGILLTMESELDGRSKWYTINYERWNAWFAETPEDDKKRIKMIRKSGSKRSLADGNRDQNDPELVDQNDPDSSPNTDQNDPVPHIYNDSEDSSSEDSLFTEDSSSSESPQPGEVPDPPTPQNDDDDDDDDILNFIQPEIQKLHLNPAKRDELLARDPAQALAIALNAQEGHSPAGLAVALMNNGGPADGYVTLAEQMIEFKTLDPDEIKRYLHARELEQFYAEANGLAYQRLVLQQQEPASEEDKSPAVVPAPEPKPELTPPDLYPEPLGPPLPLDTCPDGCDLTWRKLWHKAMFALSVRDNRLHYRLHKPGMVVQDETLTLTYVYRDTVEQYEDLLRESLEGVAGCAIPIRFEYEHETRPVPALVGGGR